MANRFLIHPFNLDQPLPQLEQLVQPGWETSRSSLADGDLQSRLICLHETVRDFVARTTTGGDRPVVIAGDCCATIGVVAGLQAADVNPVLVWFDAHGDFNTWETSPSGFIGGMPLAMLVGRGEQTLLRAAGVNPIPEQDVALVDARDLDPGEEAALRRSAVLHLTCDQLMVQLPSDRLLYVHFDTDVIDPGDAPAMTYRARGGPSARELERLFRALSRRGRIAAVSMASWNPLLDADQGTQATCMRLLHLLLE